MKLYLCVCVCAGDLAVIVEALKDALFSFEGKKEKYFVLAFVCCATNRDSQNLMFVSEK